MLGKAGYVGAEVFMQEPLLSKCQVDHARYDRQIGRQMYGKKTVQ